MGPQLPQALDEINYLEAAQEYFATSRSSTSWRPPRKARSAKSLWKVSI